MLPAHAEAVAWLAARADLVATGAAIACLLLLRASVRCERRLYAWLALLCFAGGLFTKESLLTFPLIVWLWLSWLGVERAGWHTLPFWGVLGLFWWLRAQAVAGLGAYPAAWGTLHQPWQMGIHLMVYLLQLPMPTILFGLGRDGLDTLLWLSWVIGAILLSVGGRKAPSPRSGRWLMPMFVLLSLLPVLLFKPSLWHFLNSRYSYLASVWLVVWVSGWLMESWERARWARWGTSLLLLTYAMGTLRQASDWATAGHIARSTLQSLRELPTDRPIVLISVPDHYRGAYIWRAGFEEAVRLMVPERAHLSLYALSRFTMRLSPDTAVLYSADEARLSRQEDLFLPPEGLPLPPQGNEWRVQPERVVIAPDWTRPYLLLRYEDGRFLPVR